MFKKPFYIALSQLLQFPRPDQIDEKDVTTLLTSATTDQIQKTQIYCNYWTKKEQKQKATHICLYMCHDAITFDIDTINKLYIAGAINL